MKKLRFMRSAHVNESQYVKYCGMEETTKLLKLRLNMIKFDSNYGKKGTCKICQKVEETMEHMLDCKEAKKIIGGITGSETIMSENKEELMTIYYNYIRDLEICFFRAAIFCTSDCLHVSWLVNNILQKTVVFI